MTPGLVRDSTKSELCVSVSVIFLPFPYSCNKNATAQRITSSHIVFKPGKKGKRKFCNVLFIYLSLSSRIEILPKHTSICTSISLLGLLCALRLGGIPTFSEIKGLFPNK